MTVDDWLRELNRNSGAIVAIATAASLTLTLLLLLEARTTRNLRREAALDAKVDVYGVMNLELDVANYGPANARDVSIEFGFRRRDGQVRGAPRRQRETLLAPGERCRFLPSPDQPLLDLHELADADLTLEVSWMWADDRRRLWFFPRRHRRHRSYAARDLRDGFFGGWQLTTYDAAADAHAVSESLVKMRREIEALRVIAERWDRRQWSRPAKAEAPAPAPALTRRLARLRAAIQRRLLRRGLR